MTVTKEITRQEKSSVKLSLTVPAGELKDQYDALLKKYVAGIQLPGFRKGKAPVNVVERKIGEAVQEEAVGTLMEKALQEVFQAEDFPKEDLPLAYSTPSLSGDVQKEMGKDLSFNVVYDVFPRLKVENWKGFEVEAPVVSVEKEDIQRELEDIRERNAIVMDKDEKAKAAKGDTLTVDYCELDQDGNVAAGSEREDYVFTLGSSMNIYKFDDELVGMKKGETKDFEKSYGDDETNKDLAGTTKKLRVTVKTIKEKKLPDLDDELAQDVGEQYKTLADLEADIRKKMESALDKRLKDIKISGLVEKIMEKVAVEVPETMIQMEFDNRWRGMARQFNMDVEQVKQLFSANGKGLDSMQEEWREGAEKSLKARLVVETLMNDLKLEASDEEVDALMETMSKEMDVSIEEIKKYYEADHMKEHLKEEVRERKLHELLLAENKIKKGKKTKYLDLMANNG